MTVGIIDTQRSDSRETRPSISEIDHFDVALGTIQVITAARPWPEDVSVVRNPLRNLNGETFGRLKVLCYLVFSKSSWSGYWLCRCECGRFVGVRQKSMVRSTGSTQSCGCLASQKASERGWRGHGELASNKWTHIRNHAIERNLEFSISIEQAWDLFLSQGRKCALSGVELTMGRYRPPHRINGRYPRLGTASLDRIDSDHGYVRGNIQWVHKELNRMKGALNIQEFLRFCASVTEHSRSESSWR